MTTWAPNYSPRWKGRYIAAGIEHTIQVRAQRDQSAFITQGLGAYVSSIFNLFSDDLAEDFAWIGAEFAMTDSDVFTPTAVPAPPSADQAVVNFTLRQRCTSTNLNGRGGGSRAALYMYGIRWIDSIGSPGENGRLTGAEDPRVTAAVAICTANFFANNGGSAIWHDYANIKENDHLLKLLRRGTIS